MMSDISYFLRAAIQTQYAISQSYIIHVVHIQFGFRPKHVFVHSFQNFQNTVRNNIKILDIKILIPLLLLRNVNLSVIFQKIISLNLTDRLTIK